MEDRERTGSLEDALGRALARRRAVPRNEDVHAFNCVISERLDAFPERFFWGGLQSFGDVADLAKRLGQIIGGIAVVFDDQQPHDEPVVSRIGDVPGERDVLG